MKIHSVGAELFQADGHMNRRTDKQTYITKLIVGFRNFANTANEFRE